MAAWVISTIATGAASMLGMDMIAGAVSLLGIFNTSVQGVSNVSSIIRADPNCNDINEILDEELLLEVRIKVLQHFIKELIHIKFKFNTKTILEELIPCINKCTKKIELKLKDLYNKIQYNNSIWFFKSFRKYKFGKDEIEIRNLSIRLNVLETRFYAIIENDASYIKHKIEKKEGFASIENERMFQSEYLSSQIFKKNI